MRTRTVADTPRATHPRSRGSPDPRTMLPSRMCGDTVTTWGQWGPGAPGWGPLGEGHQFSGTLHSFHLPLGPGGYKAMGPSVHTGSFLTLPKQPTARPTPGREPCTCRSCWVLGERRLLNQYNTRPSPRMERMTRRRMGPMGVRVWRWGMALGGENVISGPAGSRQGLHHSSLAPTGRSHCPP